MARSRKYSPGGEATSSRRLRVLYFGASSLWGFVVGAGGLLAGIGAVDPAARPDGAAMLALVPAAGIAFAGAGIIAGAYQEAKRRRR